LQQLIDVVRAVEEVEKAKKRIPAEFRGLTFFSNWDLWEYHLVLDDRICKVCEARAVLDVIPGDTIRMLYPYLEIVDWNKIMVNEHLNCRCFLVRTWFDELK
jgi:hypothetical protein